MNTKVSRKAIMGFLAALLLLPILSNAESLSNIEEQQNAVTKDGEQLNENLGALLTQVNAKYAEIEATKEKIAQSQEKIAQTSTEITETQENIDVRSELVQTQMREIQLSTNDQSMLQMFLSSESIAEFVSKMNAVNTLRRAQNEKISNLKEAQERLKNLKKQQEKESKALVESQARLTSEAQNMEAQVTDLKEKIATNQATLQELADAKLTEESKIAREEAMQKQQDDANANPNSGGDNPNPPQPNPGGGYTLDVEATAYSCSEPGMGYITAMGIDLRKNPMCVAVDPRVIPLGSLVEVPGYGIAIAGDTGGAIKGNIIDVHFPTVAQCYSWGRRYLTIRVFG